MYDKDGFLDNFRIKDVSMTDIIRYFQPFELKILLHIEDYTNDTDVMLENMLYYFLENEYYEFACVVRDEINRRNGTIV